tara:strand:+ start:336 stop:461 length:126 start_codon:yes stop_codon:yes gene_type:complete
MKMAVDQRRQDQIATAVDEVDIAIDMRPPRTNTSTGAPSAP